MNLIKTIKSSYHNHVDYYYVDGADLAYMQNSNYSAVYANIPNRQINNRYYFVNTDILNNEFTETFVMHAIYSANIKSISNKQIKSNSLITIIKNWFKQL